MTVGSECHFSAGRALPLAFLGEKKKKKGKGRHDCDRDIF